jgi:carbon starvation protein CstA
MSYAYYWYNFMPLARGTAAVGYTTMLGLFWAAGMPITAPIPKDYQVRQGTGTGTGCTFPFFTLMVHEGAAGVHALVTCGMTCRTCE